MPNYFTLTRVGETEPTPFARVDEEICRELGEPVDPKWYVGGWYDNIGGAIAMGKSPAWIWEQLVDTPSRRLFEIIVSKFEWDAWCQIGRR
jgi:hypothetical protein